jgi:hypothetical protein
MNVNSNICNFQQIILIKAHHVQAKHLVCNAQIGIWPLQFGEFFGGSGSCLQKSNEIPSDILSVEGNYKK